MEREREFYVWDVESNKMIGAVLIDKEVKEVVNDSLSDKETTSIGCD